MNMDKRRSRQLLPFLLSAVVVLLDQITKLIVVKKIPVGFVHTSFLNDFLWICHVQNSAIGFSVGESFPPLLKRILFILLPLIILGALVILLLRSKEIVLFQRWVLGGIIGGGVGNLIDRIFRSEGVVDFISVRVYGFLGFERWPTFNIADASIVVCGTMLLIHLIFFHKEERGSEKNE